MYTFNATFIDEEREIKLPESWSELTFSQYLDLVNGDDKDWVTRLSILTGIDKESIVQLPGEAVESLIHVISFLADKEPLVKANVIPDEWAGFKYSKVEYSHHCAIMAEVKRCTDAQLNELNFAPVLVEYCTGERVSKKEFKKGIDIRNKPVTEVLGLANFFLTASIHSWINTNSYQRKERMKNGPNGKMQVLKGLA